MACAHYLGDQRVVVLERDGIDVGVDSEDMGLDLRSEWTSSGRGAAGGIGCTATG
jgi:hypothetical protein